jgi:hypothetical protein
MTSELGTLVAISGFMNGTLAKSWHREERA